MIKANAIAQENALVLEISLPGTKTLEYQTILGKSEQERRYNAQVYINTRYKIYASQKLTKWLKQRQRALADKHEVKRSNKAGSLIVLLSYYDDLNYFKFLTLIANNREGFELVAPSINNKDHYPYFEELILPILNECEKVKGWKA